MPANTAKQGEFFLLVSMISAAVHLTALTLTAEYGGTPARCEHHRLLRHLAPGGYIVVQSTSPYFAPNAYWSVVATLEAADLHTAPYHVYVPSFGEWGYVLAARTDNFPVPSHFDVQTRYLNGETAAEMFRFPPDMARRAVEPNYLNTQKLVSYFEQDWREVQR